MPMVTQIRREAPSITARVVGNVTQVCEDFDSCGQAAKMIGSGLAAFNLFRTYAFLPHFEIPLLHFAECMKARNFVKKIELLTTGEAWGWEEIKDKDTKRKTGKWKYEAFAGYKLGSIITLLACDMCDVLRFSDRKLDLIKISRIASQVGRIPLFGRIVMLPLDRFQNTLSILGFIFGIADSSIEIARKGFSKALVLKVAENVVKIAMVVLFAASLGNTLVIYTLYGLIASSTSSFLNVARHCIEHDPLYYYRVSVPN